MEDEEEKNNKKPLNLGITNGRQSYIYPLKDEIISNLDFNTLRIYILPMDPLFIPIRIKPTRIMRNNQVRSVFAIPHTPARWTIRQERYGIKELTSEIYLEI